VSLTGALAPFVRRTRDGVRPGARCELCAAPIEADHPHVADLERRALACACRACALLFAGARSARGGVARWRTVPDRHLHEPGFTLDAARLRALGVPIHTAFVFESTAAGGWLAVYPSPAGPVEAPLEEAAARAFVASVPFAHDLAVDVEALLLTPRGATRDPSAPLDVTLIPIHAGYALIGKLRRLYRGLDGGEEARVALAEEVAALRAKGAPTPGTGSREEAS
jgi:hypothetical protein